MSAPTPCPAEDIFVALLQGELDAPTRRKVDDHLDTCPDCTRLLADLGSLNPSDPEPLPNQAPSPGQTLGRYTVRQRVGGGGMGEIFEAYDELLKRRVALKVLRPDLVETAQGSQATARLLREAQSLAAVTHPNVLPVHDIGTWNNQVFIAMHFVDGLPLSKWIDNLKHKANPPTQNLWRQILALYLTAGEGLAAAHRQGLVHRDIKPDNFLVARDGHVWVTDFGLARALDAPKLTPAEGHGIPTPLTSQPLDGASRRWPTITRTGSVMGTPAFMAPEQHLGEPTDARTDQFSFCVSLFVSIYGARPFNGHTLGALCAEVCEGRFQPPPNPSLAPKKLLDVLHRGMATKPQDRFPTTDALLAALRAASTKPLWRSPPLLVAAAVLLIALAVGFGFAFYPDDAPSLSRPLPKPLSQTLPDTDACDQHDLAACHRLSQKLLAGHTDEEGNGLIRFNAREMFVLWSQPHKPAFTWACDQGDAPSCTLLSLLAATTATPQNQPRPVGPEVATFARFAERGCALGNTLACRQVLEIHSIERYDDSDSPHTYPGRSQTLSDTLQAACNTPNAQACWWLALEYLNEMKLPPSLERATHFARLACEHGAQEACVPAALVLLADPKPACEARFKLLDTLSERYPESPLYPTDKSDRAAFCVAAAAIDDPDTARSLLQHLVNPHEVTVETAHKNAILRAAGLLARTLRHEDAQTDSLQAACAANDLTACNALSRALLQIDLSPSFSLNPDGQARLAKTIQSAQDPLLAACLQQQSAQACTLLAIFTAAFIDDLPDDPPSDTSDTLIELAARGCQGREPAACYIIYEVFSEHAYLPPKYTPPDPTPWTNTVPKACEDGLDLACFLLVDDASTRSFKEPIAIAQSFSALLPVCERQNHSACLAIALGAAPYPNASACISAWTSFMDLLPKSDGQPYNVPWPTEDAFLDDLPDLCASITTAPSSAALVTAATTAACQAPPHPNPTQRKAQLACCDLSDPRNPQ